MLDPEAPEQHDPAARGVVRGRRTRPRLQDRRTRPRHLRADLDAPEEHPDQCWDSVGTWASISGFDHVLDFVLVRYTAAMARTTLTESRSSGRRVDVARTHDLGGL